MNTLYNIISEEINNLILENRESKNINLARKYLKFNGYDDINAQKILDSIRTDIPNSRLGQCKFLKGVVRFYLNNELNDGNTIHSLNKVLPYIASEAHINEYDNDLNGMGLNDIINRFSASIKQDSELSRQNSYSKQHIQNTDYKIVKIPDFNTASQYGEYTQWCVTHSSDMYDSYTNNGIGLFYFCLKNGFENIPKEKGENAPLDEYGLSMIAVSVDEDGEPNTITCRWNHDMNGNDHIMTKDELEELLGVNFYEVFKPYTEDELMSKGKVSRKLAVELLSQGVDPKDIFDYIGDMHEGLTRVELNNKCSFIDSNNRLIGDGKLWFTYASSFNNGFAKVNLNNKWSFIDTNGKLIGDGNQWFDDVNDFEDRLAKVQLNNKYSLINKKGELIYNGKLWFNWINNVFKYDFAIVELDDKCTLIGINGKLIGDGNLWFDDVGDFYNGFAAVQLNNKWSFIDTEGNYIKNGKLWFDRASNFKNGFASVGLNNKYTFIDTNGNYIKNGELWFDYASPFKTNFAIVELNNKYSLLSIEGNLIYNGKLWFDELFKTKNDFYITKLNNKWTFINPNGKLIGGGNLWFSWIDDFINDFAKVELKGKFSFINTNGELIGNGKLWFDTAYDFNNGYAVVQVNNGVYNMDTNLNFYDYYTDKPITSPFQSTNENKINITKIIKESINSLIYKKLQ